MSWFDQSIMARNGVAKGKPGASHNITEATQGKIAVGTLIAERPPHRSVRAEFPHTAPTLGV
jgi:hypothetical protein